MKKRRLFLAALALVLVLSAGIGGAVAYFTTYTSALGGATVHLGNERTFEEQFADWTKTLTVKNNDDSDQAIYVRAQVFWPEALYLGPERTRVPLTCEIGGDGWSQTGEYYYFGSPVQPGDSTSVLNVKISGLQKDSPYLEELKKLEEGDAFNVIVVYESIPVSYDEDGNLLNPAEADWTQALDYGTTEGGFEP